MKNASSSSPRGLDITIVGLNYAPEPTGIAPYTTGLARGLARTNNVRVITGQPHYPAWVVSDGYGRATDTMDGDVSLRRVNHRVPADPTNIRRTALELSFGLRSVMSSWHRPDVVVCVSPALFASGLAFLRTSMGVPAPATAVWVQDLYSLGVKETGSAGGMGSRLVTAAERRVLKAADGVAVIHDRFAAHAVDELGVDARKVVSLRNWAHVDHSGATAPSIIRERFGWEHDETIVLHAGNMGLKQGLENVVESARLADRVGAKVRFVLLGDGRERKALEQLGQGIERLQFIHTLDDADFSGALAAADVLLVNEMTGVAEMSVPSKLTSYFSAGRPVVGAVSPLGAAAAEINASGAGVVVGTGEPALLLQACVRLGEDHARSKELGEAGDRYAKLELAESAQIAKWDGWLNQLVEARARRFSPAPRPTLA